ncbi:MAG: hypothetical protein RLZZ385_2179 [Pseudomonadota bacterium]|jgi:2-octaprenyl-6-methoxyphenol hydroxylase
MLTDSPAAHYPVVIVGGGMVGASFALALQTITPVPLLVVEAGGGDIDAPVSFDARSTAISYGSSLILARLGLWDALTGSAEPIRQIHVSDRGHFGTVRMDSASQKVEALGYVVENRVLGTVLHDAIGLSEQIALLRSTRVSSVQPVSQGMVLELETGGRKTMLSADLVVLADGGRSPICRQLGITVDVRDYRQQAIICNVALGRPHGNVAYERFTDSGPMAILPLPRLQSEYRGALVWTVGADESADLMAKPEAELLELLQDRFGHRLGSFRRMGQRFSYPLNLTVATEQVRPGLVLLGNAAHTLHPVAGQGFNLALRDAQALAATVGAALQRGENPGELSVLQRFVDQQQGDQQLTIGFSHYLTQVFTSRRYALVWARKFGLACIDLLPTVKQEFARQAMGLGNRIHKVARQD